MPRWLHCELSETCILEVREEEEQGSAPCAQAVMRELKVTVLGTQPSPCISANSSSASSHCPAFSHALIRLE